MKTYFYEKQQCSRFEFISRVQLYVLHSRDQTHRICQITKNWCTDRCPVRYYSAIFLLLLEHENLQLIKTSFLKNYKIKTQEELTHISRSLIQNANFKNSLRLVQAIFTLKTSNFRYSFHSVVGMSVYVYACAYWQSKAKLKSFASGLLKLLHLAYIYVRTRLQFGAPASALKTLYCARARLYVTDVTSSTYFALFHA